MATLEKRERLMRIAARRAIVTVVLMPALVFSGACSGGGSDHDLGSTGKESSAGAPDTRSGTGGGGGEGNRSGGGDSSDENAARKDGTSSAGPRAKERLRKAALTPDDLGHDYQVSSVPDGDALTSDVLTADRPGCQPIADIMSAKPKYRRMATVNKNIARSGIKPGTVTFTSLASYRADEARRAFAELKNALGACDSFTTKEEKDAIAVRKAKGVTLGDEALAFTLSAPGDKEQVMLVHVVRVGSTQAVFAGIDITGQRPAVAESVIREQIGKLRGASAGG